MVGFALRAVSITRALSLRQVILRFDEDAQCVCTGDPLPDWPNAVVRMEAVDPLDEASATGRRPAQTLRCPAV